MLVQMPLQRITLEVTTYSVSTPVGGKSKQWKAALQPLVQMPLQRITFNAIAYNTFIPASGKRWRWKDEPPVYSQVVSP